MRGFIYSTLWAIFHIIQVYSRRNFAYMAGRHVCARRVPDTKKYPQEESVCIPRIQTFLRPCTFDGSKPMCRGYRKIYTTVKRIVYKSKRSSTKVQFSCCPGWTRKPFKHGCNIPVCPKKCSNNGLCIAPGKCKCKKSWKGQYCEKEENKCLINNGGCQQNCINTDGIVRCECRQGYNLMKDGKTCGVCLTCSEEWQVMNRRIQTLEQLTYTLTDKLMKVENITSQSQSSLEDQTETQSDISSKEKKDLIAEKTNKLQNEIMNEMESKMKEQDEKIKIDYNSKATLQVFSTLVEKVAYLEATMASCGCGKLDIFGNIIAPNTSENSKEFPKTAA